MMKLAEEFKSVALTVRFNELCERSKRIGEMIGDRPIIFFPDQHERLIELAEEEYEIATRLYQLYIDNGEFNRAALMLDAEQMIEKSLFYLKKDKKIIA